MHECSQTVLAVIVPLSCDVPQRQCALLLNAANRVCVFAVVVIVVCPDTRTLVAANVLANGDANDTEAT